MNSLILSIVNDRDCDLNKQFVIVVSHGSPLVLAQELMGLGDERLETAGYRIIPISQVQKFVKDSVKKKRPVIVGKIQQSFSSLKQSIKGKTR